VDGVGRSTSIFLYRSYACEQQRKRREHAALVSSNRKPARGLFGHTYHDEVVGDPDAVRLHRMPLRTQPGTAQRRSVCAAPGPAQARGSDPPTRGSREGAAAAAAQRGYGRASVHPPDHSRSFQCRGHSSTTLSSSASPWRAAAATSRPALCWRKEVQGRAYSELLRRGSRADS
jgi:hypothetical protein